MTAFHPRIHPVNYPILSKYDDTHPAVRVLQAHAEARDACVGKEIEWPKLRNCAIEQEWYSIVDGRVWRFSAFAYAFVSFDLVLDGWLGENHAHLQPFEADFLCELPRLRRLLDECRSAANADGNNSVLPLISKANNFFNTLEESVIARTGPVSVERKGRRIESLWGTGKAK